MTDLGKILILPKDEWSSLVTYEILDAVTHEGKAYFSKKNNNSAEPSGQTDANWFMFAQDGFPSSVTATKSGGVVTLTMVNVDGTTTVQVLDGTDGESVSIVSATKVGKVTTVILEDKNGQTTLTINDGLDGRGIQSVTKVSQGLEDAYTITYTDDTTYTFTVTNGKGITSIAKTSSSTDPTGRVVDTYTITYNDGTTQTYTVTNGKDGTGTGDMEKSVYDTDNDGKVDAAETADSVEWFNVDNRPFDVIGNTLEVTNETVGSSSVPTLNAKVMTGANSQRDGAPGTVPTPYSGDQDKFLAGNGTWKAFSPFTGATSDTDGQAGAVPMPLMGDNGKYLDGDGTWKAFPTLGHTIKNPSGTSMAQREGLQFTGNGINVSDDSANNKTVVDISGLGIRVSSTVSDDSVSFTNAAIGNTSIIDGPYIQDVLVGVVDAEQSSTTVTFTLSDDSADGKTAYIWVRSV